MSTTASDMDAYPKTREVETVEDGNGNVKQMVGRPAGLTDFDIPTGESDLDWRCPGCGEIGYYSRGGYPNPSCTNRECRVDKYSPHVRGPTPEILADGNGGDGDGV